MNFCKRCGAPLQVAGPSSSTTLDDPGPSARVCDSCKGVLDKDARFCKYCGTRLDAPEGEAPAAESPKAEGGRDEPTRTGPLGSAPEKKQSRARLIAILKDGSEGQVYDLDGEPTEIGRKEGNILLADDPYMSPRHARISSQEGRHFIKDLASTNGIFVSIREPSRLHHDDVLLIGQQVLRFEVLEEAEQGLGPASQHGTLLFGTPEGGCFARLCQVTTEGIVRDVYHLRAPEVIIGREGRDVVFPDDPFMSRRHARITFDSGSRSFVLEDLGSFNGTSLRFRGERELRGGDQFRVGNHLFRFEVGGVER
jgi:pSer/pThr/pTyr-binding forkhead associated (FHA) protein